MVNKDTVVIGSDFCPIIFAGVLRESLPVWNFEYVAKAKQPRNRGKLRDTSIEKRIVDMQNRYKSLSDRAKCDLFPFTFKIKRKSEILEYSSGPQIFLNLSGRPVISFSDFPPYFPQGVSKSENTLEIFHMASLIEKIEGDGGKMTLDQIEKFEDLFGVSIQVWTKMPRKFGTAQKIKGYDYQNIFFGNYDYDHEIFFHMEEKTDKLFFITDVKKYFNQFLICKNRPSGCYYTFEDRKQKTSHEKNCLTETGIKVVQKEFGLNSNLFEKAENLGLLPRNLKLNDNFIFWDIESVLPSSNEEFGKTKVQSLHKLVSISANSHINGEHCTRVWTVRDSSENAEFELVETFVHFCQDQLRRVKFDDKLEEAYKKVCEIGKSLRFGVKNKDFDQTEISKLKTYIESRLELSVFGYNSSRYDLAIIFSRICQVLDKDDFDRKKISLLKKGLAYFSVKIGRLHFKDLLNFSAPMGLDRYLRIWTDHSHKLVYPYEKFESIEEIRNCKIFPDISDFKTGLKPDVDEKVYSDCKKMFEEKMSLPDSDPEKWNSFEDYLKFYNISDVYPASLALLKQFATYLENFGSYPMSCLGLPSYAKQCMFDLYNHESPNIFTFSDKEATNLFRQQIIGGLTAVYKRHITLTDEAAPSPAKYSRSG